MCTASVTKLQTVEWMAKVHSEKYNRFCELSTAESRDAKKYLGNTIPVTAKSHRMLPMSLLSQLY